MGIAADIQRELDRRDWRLYRLHQESGILHQTLRSIMEADSNPGIDKVIKIARAFGITIDELVQNPKPLKRIEKKPMTPKDLKKVLLEYGLDPDDAAWFVRIIGEKKRYPAKEERSGNGEAEGPIA